MVEGAPYIHAPGGDGLLQSLAAGSTTAKGALLSSMFGYRSITPAVLVLQFLCMPMLLLLDGGVPVLWREALGRCCQPRVTQRPQAGYSKLTDDAFAA